MHFYPLMATCISSSSQELSIAFQMRLFSPSNDAKTAQSEISCCAGMQECLEAKVEARLFACSVKVTIH